MEHTSVQMMWKRYLETFGEIETDRKYQSWYFCDNKEDADELLELVLSGVKRATASLYLSFQTNGEEIPKAGDLSIITNWAGEAKCILKTTKVEVLPFREVSEDFARIEGEGDKSLEYWKRAHLSFFGRELKNLGKEMDEDMIVVCEEFEVVFR